MADAQGLSYYSDPKLARLLSLSAAEVRHARAQLLQAGLIAFEPPLYQVLSLEAADGPAPEPASRPAQALPLSAILRQMLDTGKDELP